MSDSLHNRVRYRMLKVIDDFNREILGIDLVSVLYLRNQKKLT